MSLQFVIGASGAGKSRLVYDRIIENSEKHPEERYMLLVPEQASLTAQQKLIERHPRHALFGIEVVSFTRLAYHVFDELGLRDRKLLDENGKAMILKKVVLGQRGELRYFGRNLERVGFISELKSVLSEFLQCRVEEDTLERLSAEAETEPLLQHKLRDLQTIYRAFREALAEDYTTAEEQCELLAQVIGRSERMRRTHVVIEDFNGFTPVQYQVLEELLRTAPDVTVVLTLRPDCLRQPPSEYELFAMSRTVMERLVAAAGRHGIQVRRTEELSGTRRFEKADDLRALEAGFDAWSFRPYEAEPEHIALSVMKNPEEEVCCALEEILRLVREGFCYREIAVVTGDLGGYAPLIRYYFGKAGLPVFIDEKAGMRESLLVRFLLSALQMVENNFDYESVFRFLKCGLVPLEPEQIDRIENYALATGIRSLAGWEREWDRVYRGLDADYLPEYNAIREKVAGWLGTFGRAVRAQDAAVEVRIAALETLLETMEVREQLAGLSEAFHQSGDYAKEMEYGQSYEKLEELFEQFRALMGTDVLSFSEFADTLRAGLEGMQVGILPPTLDRLVVGDLRRTRLADVRAILILGANDGVIPFAVQQGGILSEPDREFFRERRVELAASAREESFHQRYYLYLALTKASERLWISGSRMSGDGRSLRLSVLYTDLRRIFSRLRVRDTVCGGVLTPETSISRLAEGARAFAAGEEDAGWRELYRWYRGKPQWSEKLAILLDGAFYVYRRERLNGRICTALYGEHPAGSVTRLESFASCEYAHFLTYGLGLHPRQEYELKAADFGNVYHSALEFFFHEMEREGLSWRELEEEKRRELAERSVRLATEEYANTIFMSSARNRYLTEQILAVTDRTVWALGRQLKLGTFEPAGSELQFTPGDRLESMQLMTEDGRRISLAGRIDRIDVSVERDRVYVRVIDYKSGQTSFDYTRVYYGLQLQLALYMGAALELVEKKYPGKQVIPAGIFYYNIQDPLVDGTEGMTEEELDDERLKRLRVNGLIASDEGVIERMETVRGRQSKFVQNVNFRDDGRVSERSGAVTGRQLARLCAFAKEKAEELSSSLYRGEISVNPYEYKGYQPCTWCPYGAVCGFDEAVPGYRRRRLRSFTAEDFWDRQEEEEQDADSLDRASEKGN